MPNSIGASPGAVPLGHLVGSSNVKAFKPREGVFGEIPCLTTIQKDGLDYRLVELGGDAWFNVLTP